MTENLRRGPITLGGLGSPASAAAASTASSRLPSASTIRRSFAWVPEKTVRLIVTSPPYNIGKKYERRVNLEEYLKAQAAVIKECARVLADDGSLCWQVGNFVDNNEIVPLDIALWPIFRDQGLTVYNKIIYLEGAFTRLAQAKKTLKFRKFPKREQRIIVAFKGDVRTIEAEFPPIGRL